MTLETAMEEFLLACRADGLAPKTVKWYGYTLGALVATFPGCKLHSITTRRLREYIAGQYDRLAADSAAGHVRALHRFFSWCSTEYNTPNPMTGIRRAPQPRPMPKAIDPADFVRLFQATGDSVAGIRDRALLAFMADTGCRLGGLLSLQIDRLDLDARRATLHEKRKSTRRVPFTHYTGALLSHWLEHRPAGSNFVFTTMAGQPLTESGLHEVLKRLKRRAGVTGRVNPHSFRHNFAREYLRSGGDLVTLARLLGHSNINTTVSFYAVFSEDELGDAHDKHSPLRRLLEGEKS